MRNIQAQNAIYLKKRMLHVFVFKKVISALLLPLPMACLLLIFSLFCLSRKRLKAAMITVSLTLGLLFFSAITPISNEANLVLAKKYALLLQAPRNIDTIVVLGGGTNSSKAHGNNGLNAASMQRLIEGVRLAKQIITHKQPLQLILSGGYSKPSSATLMQQAAIMLGIPKKFTFIENQSKDTYDEAIEIRRIIHSRPFILVTSAVHMPRSMALFRKQGLHPIAAPTAVTYNTERKPKILNYIPTASNMAQLNSAWHEYLGLTWAKLKGLI